MANKKKEILLRAYLGFVVICLLGMAIIGRTVYIQTVKGPYYRSLADSLTIHPEKKQADRGNIYADDGRLLATTLPTFDIRIDFKTLYDQHETFDRDVDSLAIMLAQTFKDKTKEQYKNELVTERLKKSRYYLLKKAVDYKTAQDMKKWPLFREGQYVSGMIAVQNDERKMPFGGLALRTIGSISTNGQKIGLEGQYDEQLRGVQGEIMVQKISGGVSIPLDTKEQIAPQAGKDLFTTINVEFQDVAEEALHNALLYHKAEHGCVVLMEVKTGKIKAIANQGLTKDSGYAEIQNYAVGEAMEPGSTFKLVTVASLMEDGLANSNTLINVGDGVAHFYNTTVRDHEAPETPQITLKRAIETSSNAAMAQISFDNYSHNPEKFYKHLVDFGFDKKINIELPGAAQPVLAAPQKWSGVSTAFIAHGYEIRITPLHTLMFYNAIANNGVMVQPRIVDKIKEYNRVVDSMGTIVLNDHLFSERTVKAMQDMLVGVVENGTAKKLINPDLRIAGKTGTAVIAQGNKGYTKRVYMASFCGYFPAEDPQYSMIVVIKSPSENGFYGAEVAGVIFKEVAEKVYSLNLNMQKPVNELPVAENNLPSIEKGDAKEIEKLYAWLGASTNNPEGTWANVNASGKSITLQPMNVDGNVMPDVTGMSLKDAIYLLENKGMKVTIVGKGRVIKQSVETGEHITKGMPITIELS